MVRLQHVSLGFGKIRTLHAQNKVKISKSQLETGFWISDTKMTTNVFLQKKNG